MIKQRDETERRRVEREKRRIKFLQSQALRRHYEMLGDERILRRK